MPTAEESNAAMATISHLQAAYAAGEVGLPPGADWVESALAYLEHGGVYTGAEATELLTGYGILSQGEAPPPPPPAEPPSFWDAADHPQWWEDFKAHVATEFSSENPDFVDAVRFESMDPQAIYDTFVQVGSAREVNISGALRTPIDTAFEGDEAPGYDIFAAASKEIFAVMQKDSWPRFLALQT
jgi:hypothetical protein